MSTARPLPEDDLALLVRSTRETRSQPEKFQRGAKLIEETSSVTARRRYVRASLRQYIRELRAEGLDPKLNGPTKAFLEDRLNLMPSRLTRLKSYSLPAWCANKELAFAEATMGRDQAEAIVLLAAYHYDDNPTPNTAMPPCFAKPRPEDLTEHERHVFYGIGLMGRREPLPHLMQRLRWAWARIDSWATDPASSAQGTPEAHVIDSTKLTLTAQGLFKRSGTAWMLSFEGQTATARNLVGMTYIRQLLESPNRPVNVWVLKYGSKYEDDSEAQEADHSAEEKGVDDLAVSQHDELHAESSFKGDEVMDKQAIAEARARAAELQDLLKEAVKPGNERQQENIRRELEQLADIVRAATGVGGKRRRMPAAVEKCRGAVRSAIRDALAEVDSAHAAIARHLRSSLVEIDGSDPCYRPTERVTWETS